LLTDGASYNTVENVSVHHCYFAGFEIENAASHNVIVNCDSYLNCDYGDTHGEHADGFGVKFDVGKGNVLRYCRAWANSDDGFDLWEANNKVVIEYCYSYKNGFDRWEIGSLFSGDGNGFKLGPGGHLIHHCIAWKNALRGFDFNDALQTLYVFNNTSYSNPVGYKFAEGRHVLKNNLSFRDGENLIGPECVSEKNSWMYDSIPVDSFLSLSSDKLEGERLPDGSLPESGFLKPSLSFPFLDKGTDVGLSYFGKAPEIGAVEVRIHFLPPVIIPENPSLLE
jgi:hypothetical protein